MSTQEQTDKIRKHRHPHTKIRFQSLKKGDILRSWPFELRLSPIKDIVLQNQVPTNYDSFYHEFFNDFFSLPRLDAKKSGSD